MFDKMALSEELTYSKSTDKFVGYVDLGTPRRQNIVVNHVLVLMVRGVRKSFKQPVTYYFMRDTIKTKDLTTILSEVITAV